MAQPGGTLESLAGPAHVLAGDQQPVVALRRHQRLQLLGRQGDALGRRRLGADIRDDYGRLIAPPDGAFYIYADISSYTEDSLAFCLRLLEETGVATAPGVDFDPVDGHRFMRFSFALSTAEIQEALTRLEPWFAAQPRR